MTWNGQSMAEPHTVELPGCLASSTLTGGSCPKGHGLLEVVCGEVGNLGTVKNVGVVGLGWPDVKNHGHKMIE